MPNNFTYNSIPFIPYNYSSIPLQTIQQNIPNLSIPFQSIPLQQNTFIPLQQTTQLNTSIPLQTIQSNTSIPSPPPPTYNKIHLIYQFLFNQIFHYKIHPFLYNKIHLILYKLYNQIHQFHYNKI
ncbi:hypothetical protein ABK040_012803 [Willaertia magna]